MKRPIKRMKAGGDRFFNCARRISDLTEEAVGIFHPLELDNCTVIPKDVFINADGFIIPDVLSTKKSLYSKPI